MKRALSLGLLLASFSTSERPARAQEEKRISREWYGYLTLSSDAAAVGVLAIGQTSRVSSYRENTAWVSLFIYGLGAPTIHWAHGNVGTGFASVGLRVGGPIVLGFAGCAVDGSKGEFGCLGGFALGLLLGTVSAVIVDATALAYKEVELPPPRYGVRLTPSASLTKEGATFGLSAVF